MSCGKFFSLNTDFFCVQLKSQMNLLEALEMWNKNSPRKEGKHIIICFKNTVFLKIYKKSFYWINSPFRATCSCKTFIIYFLAHFFSLVFNIQAKWKYSSTFFFFLNTCTRESLSKFWSGTTVTREYQLLSSLHYDLPFLSSLLGLCFKIWTLTFASLLLNFKLLTFIKWTTEMRVLKISTFEGYLTAFGNLYSLGFSSEGFYLSFICHL